MLLRKAYKENIKKLDELIEICKKQQEIINNLKFEIDLRDKLIDKQQ